MPNTLSQDSSINRIGYIYLIEAKDAIKVGFSEKPCVRFSTIQSAHYQPLKLLGFFEANLQAELLFHKQFASKSLSGEWYPIADKQAILEFLRNCENFCFGRSRLKALRLLKIKPPRVAVVKALPRPIEVLLTPVEKAAYIEQHFNIFQLLTFDGVLHRESAELLPLLDFAKKRDTQSLLGFKISKNKGKPDTIRYLSWIVDLFGYQLKGAKQRDRKDGSSILRNVYRIVKRPH